MIALRHSVTCHYLNALCEWVLDLDQAYDFVDSSAAERFCNTRGLSNVDILLVFHQGPCLVIHLEG